ncbi:hypothetical protein B0H66DRAFT_467853 [Apodospora peruviana]|uniref:Uncharacterized protein n=1 Tax=Apodospora peruviana TaxID=516989 RepID=A0AAE0MGC9_9PEZI|nr:hypothetical protein B0H66DRAFT_467853 [Apodospora peruviana]
MDGTLATTHAGGPSDAIRVSNVYFSNLVRVGKIRLEWVDSMTEHLALDERTRTLKLFKYPAYCALICLSEPDSVAFLNKLIGDTDYEDNSVSSSSSLGAISSQPPFDNFCREVLISMGVIFAQESRSRDEVKRFVAKWPQRLKEDALFGKLCARSWQDHILFQYLNSPPVRSNYSAQADFPFLGARLLRIQEYMDAQTPNDFGTLIFDRRDHLRYWTFMSIFIFGVLSVGFQVLQVALVTLQILLDAKGPQAT